MGAPNVDDFGNYVAGGISQFTPAGNAVSSNNGPILIFPGVPTGVALAGTIAFDTATNTFYTNTDGGTTWVAVAGGGTGTPQQVYSGSGAPGSLTPDDPSLAALYVDLGDGSLYTWNPNSAAWQ